MFLARVGATGFWRLPILLAWIFAVSSATVVHAGLAFHTDIVQALDGKPVPRASILVTELGSTTKAKLFTDKAGLRPAQNPIATDERGRFRFYVVNGNYDLKITGQGVDYALTDVMIIDPSEPHTIRASGDAPALTLIERAEKTSQGNTALLFNRPGSLDPNNPPVPYRVIVNKGELGWALTWNVDWDEVAGQWAKLDRPRRTFFFRINGLDSALEYGNDTRRVDPPVMETLFRLDRTGDVQVTAHLGDVALEMTHDVKVAGKLAALRPGDVVVMDPIRPYTVIAPQRTADKNPVVVLTVDPNDQSRVFVLLAGSSKVRTPYTAKSIDDVVKGGAPLVTEGANSLRAVVGKEPVDPRTALGWIQDQSNGFRVVVP